MTLYRRELNDTLTLLSTGEEATALADPGSMFGSDAEHGKFVFASAYATAIRAEWAANEGADPVPASVTRAQARAALFKAGLLDTIDAYVAGLTGDDGRLTQIWWADALNFERASPTIAAIGTVLGLTSDQIDGLFRTADGLSA